MGRYRIYSGLNKFEPFTGYRGRIVDFPLDRAPTACWARSRLPKPLTGLLDLSTGTWSASLPDDTPEGAAHTFDEGILPEPSKSAWEHLDVAQIGSAMAERLAASLGCAPEDLIFVPKYNLVPFAADWILKYLAETPSGVALVHEMNGESRSDVTHWTHPSSVLYPVQHRSHDQDSLSDLMDDAAGPTGAMALLSRTAAHDPAVSLPLSDAELTDLYVGANGLVLSAYDDESYIYWRCG